MRTPPNSSNNLNTFVTIQIVGLVSKYIKCFPPIIQRYNYWYGPFLGVLGFPQTFLYFVLK